MSIATTESAPFPQTAENAVVRSARPRRKTLGTLLGVVLLLATAEAGLRVRAWYRHGSDGPVASIYEPDELLGRRPRPGATLSGSARQLSINRWGFRGADLPQVKPPGTVRVAALGDSTTFGMEAASDEAVWVARMMKQLNALNPGSRYDALNAAVPGYTLETSRLRLAERVAPFAPDVVVIYQAGTDIAAHSRRQFPPAAQGRELNSGLAHFAQRHCLLLNLIRVNTVAFTACHTAPRRHDLLDERGVEAYADQVRVTIELCRQRGWRVVLCTCPRAFGDPDAPTDQHQLAQTALANNPALSLPGLNDAYERYNDALRAVARELDATLVDLDRLVPKRREYFADSVHLSDTGHALVGEEVAEVVLNLDRDGSSAQVEASGAGCYAPPAG